jgi:hypothetical protein
MKPRGSAYATNSPRPNRRWQQWEVSRLGERLIVEYDEENPFADEYPEEFEQQFATREAAGGEVSINRWAGGNPARAMVIAEEYAERRASLLMQQRLNEYTYKQKLARLDEWMAAEEERLGKRIEWIDHLLEMYAHDFHPKDKTVRLPSAELKRRANRARIEWAEDDALRYQEQRWPEDVTRKLNKAALKERLKKSGGGYVDTETGEFVEFVREVPPETPETFTVVQEVSVDGE